MTFELLQTIALICGPMGQQRSFNDYSIQCQKKLIDCTEKELTATKLKECIKKGYVR